MEKTEDLIEFASHSAVQNARDRSGTFDNSRCNHVIIARERIAVGALAGCWSYLAHSIHHGNWVCAPFLRILQQSTTPLISPSGGAHGAGAPFFLQAKKTAMTWHNLADSVLGGIFALIVGAPLARRILNPNMPLPRAPESYP